MPRRISAPTSTHVCELPEADRERDQGIHAEIKTTAKNKITRKVNNFFTITASNPFTAEYFRSKAAIRQERRRHLYMKNAVPIHPLSKFAFVRQICMSIFWFSAFVLQPFFWKPWTENAWPVFPYYFLDKICLLDVGFNLCCGYIDKDTNEVVLQRRSVVMQYVKTYFLIDIVGNLLDVVGMFCFWGSRWWAFMNMVGGAVRLLRMKTALQYVTNFLITGDVLHLRKALFHMIVVAIILIHWSAGLSYAAIFIGKGLGHGKNTWIVVEDFNYEVPYMVLYLHCLRRAMCLFYRAASSITAELKGEQCLNSMILIGGTVTYAAITTVIFKLITTETMIENKARCVSLYLKKYWRFQSLPMSVRQRVWSYYERRYQKKYFKEHEILTSISETLKCEIALLICKPLIETAFIFREFPKPLVGSLVACLHQEYFIESDVIFRAWDNADSMYFVACGTLAVYSELGAELYHLEDKDHFGEISMLLQRKRNTTVVSIELTELYRLDYVDFCRCITEFPNTWKDVVEFAGKNDASSFD